MFCPHCGSEIKENGLFCPNCGTQVTTAQQYQQPDYYQQGSVPYQENTPTPPVTPYPMGWFKFLIYFALFASTVLNLYNAYKYFSGSVYGTAMQANYVYMYFNGLKTIDMIYAIVCIVLAVLAIVARFALAGYKKNGPMLLNTLYIVNIVTGIIYMIAVYIIISSVLDAATAVGIIAAAIPGFIGAIVFLIINTIYFNKRKSLFVN